MQVYIRRGAFRYVTIYHQVSLHDKLELLLSFVKKENFHQLAMTTLRLPDCLLPGNNTGLTKA